MCTCRLQPTRDDCTVRVQWFSSVIGHSSKECVSLHQFLMAAKPRHILTQTYRPEKPCTQAVQSSRVGCSRQVLRIVYLAVKR